MGKFATFLIGGAVGAVAGLLLSPRSGAENRALLSEVANEKCGTVSCPPQLQEKAGQFVEAAASTSTKVINTVVDNGAEARRAVSERAQKFVPAPVQAFDANGDELRQKIDAARERIATQVAKNAEAARDAAVDKVPAVLDAAAAAKETATGAAQHAAEAVQGAAATAADAAKEAAGTAQHAAAVVAEKVRPSDK